MDVIANGSAPTPPHDSFVADGSPAAMAGLRVGDHFVEINGVDVSSEPMIQIESLMKRNPSASVVVQYNAALLETAAAAAAPVGSDGQAAPTLNKGTSGAYTRRVGAPAPPAMVHHLHTTVDTQNNEVRHAMRGLQALLSGHPRRAEGHFMEALHLELRPADHMRMVEASKAATPDEAKARLAAVLTTVQRGKAGVQYLIGLARLGLGRELDAQEPFTEVVRQCFAWHYDGNATRIDPSDPQFHILVGQSMADWNKPLHAAAAFQQALFRGGDAVAARGFDDAAEKIGESVTRLVFIDPLERRQTAEPHEKGGDAGAEQQSPVSATSPVTASATPSDDWFTVALERSSKEQSFGFGLGSASNGAKMISKVTPGGLAQGQLEVGDCVREVDGVAVTGMRHDELVERIMSTFSLRLRIERQKWHRQPLFVEAEQAQRGDPATNIAPAAESGSNATQAADAVAPDPEDSEGSQPSALTAAMGASPDDDEAAGLAAVAEAMAAAEIEDEETERADFDSFATGTGADAAETEGGDAEASS